MEKVHKGDDAFPPLTTEQLKAVASFAMKLKEIHVRLVTVEGFTVKNGKLVPPEGYSNPH